MPGPKVRLSVTPTRFVCTEADLDREAPARSLVLPAATFAKAVALAETRKGFRAPRHQFLPRHTSDFAAALKEALGAPVVAGGRSSERFAPLRQLREFFEQPAQARLLAKLLAFVEGGGTMDIQPA